MALDHGNLLKSGLLQSSFISTSFLTSATSLAIQSPSCCLSSNSTHHVSWTHICLQISTTMLNCLKRLWPICCFWDLCCIQYSTPVEFPTGLFKNYAFQSATQWIQTSTKDEDLDCFCTGTGMYRRLLPLYHVCSHCRTALIANDSPGWSRCLWDPTASIRQ